MAIFYGSGVFFAVSAGLLLIRELYRIVNLALALVGHIRGGLGYVTIMAACLMAALSGSAVADTAALAALLLPMMVAAAGHDKARAGGLIASAGIIAPIIPPSIGFVIFGVSANVSISKLFLAGIVPGLMMGVAIAITWWLVARKEGVKPPPKTTTAEKLKAFREATRALVLPLIVLVGLKIKSAWAAEGGYEPVAEVLFNELDVDGYFLEYDDARSGDFAPLRHVPKTKTVVLGLVSTKLVALESKDDIKRRIDAAAKFMPIGQMALSPQCGFSSTVHGNAIQLDAQRAKLALVVETARDVWGET